MSNPFVTVLTGSDNDTPTLKLCADVLDTLDINHEVRVLSAHHTPQALIDYVIEADNRGCHVFIAISSIGGHLGGAIAANTVKPVITLPLDIEPFNGTDTLVSSIQMPQGVPVACVGVGKHGAKNAAIMAAEIIALHDIHVREKLSQMRQQKRSIIDKTNQRLKSL